MFASEIKLGNKAARKRRTSLSMLSPESMTPRSRGRVDELRGRGPGGSGHSSLDTLIDTMAVLGVFVDTRSGSGDTQPEPRLYVGDPMRASTGRARRDTLRRSGSLSSLLDASSSALVAAESPTASGSGEGKRSPRNSLLDEESVCGAGLESDLNFESPPHELESILMSGGRELCPGLLSLPVWPGQVVETMAGNDPRCVVFFGTDSEPNARGAAAAPAEGEEEGEDDVAVSVTVPGAESDDASEENKDALDDAAFASTNSDADPRDKRVLQFRRASSQRASPAGKLGSSSNLGAKSSAPAGGCLKELTAADVLEVITFDTAPLLKCVVLVASNSREIGEQISHQLPHLFVICFGNDFRWSVATTFVSRFLHETCAVATVATVGDDGLDMHGFGASARSSMAAREDASDDGVDALNTTALTATTVDSPIGPPLPPRTPQVSTPGATPTGTPFDDRASATDTPLFAASTPTGATPFLTNYGGRDFGRELVGGPIPLPALEEMRNSVRSTASNMSSMTDASAHRGRHVATWDTTEVLLSAFNSTIDAMAFDIQNAGGDGIVELDGGSSRPRSTSAGRYYGIESIQSPRGSIGSDGGGDHALSPPARGFSEPSSPLAATPGSSQRAQSVARLHRRNSSGLYRGGTFIGAPISFAPHHTRARRLSVVQAEHDRARRERAGSSGSYSTPTSRRSSWEITPRGRDRAGSGSSYATQNLERERELDELVKRVAELEAALRVATAASSLAASTDAVEEVSPAAAADVAGVAAGGEDDGAFAAAVAAGVAAAVAAAVDKAVAVVEAKWETKHADAIAAQQASHWKLMGQSAAAASTRRLQERDDSAEVHADALRSLRSTLEAASNVRVAEQVTVHAEATAQMRGVIAKAVEKVRHSFALWRCFAVLRLPCTR